MTYVVGFFFADGSMDINPRGSQYFSIQICDRELLEHIRESLGSNHKIATRIGKGVERNKYRLQIGSKEMCDDLRKLGIHEQKAYTMFFPKVPQKYVGDFIRGYFDGDGNVWCGFIHKERKKSTLALHTVFTSCSEKFLTQLQKILVQQGMSKGSFCFTNRAYRLQYSIFDSILLYQVMYGNLDSDLFLERKKMVFEKYMRERP